MWPSIIAVLGTLAGVVGGGVVHARVQRAAHRDQEHAARQAARLDAVTALVAALDAHRCAMYLREDQRLDGQDWSAARAASHETRAAISTPMTRVAILVPTLSDAAREAARATYALRHAPDHDALADRRRDALAACERLVEAAADHLTD
jgi:hypothetical protein